MPISNDLIEAYEGFYEEDDEFIENWGKSTEWNNGNYDFSVSSAFLRKWCEQKIISHTPKERLDIYLTWNGVLGYTDRIYEVATGHL